MAPDSEHGAVTHHPAQPRSTFRRYCTLVFAQTGSYDGTARPIGIDRRTVKDKVDPAFLAELGKDASPSHNSQAPGNPSRRRVPEEQS